MDAKTRPDGGDRFEATLIYPAGWVVLSPWICTIDGHWYRHHVADPFGSSGIGEVARDHAQHLATELNALLVAIEKERDELAQAWVKVCQEGNVPQYENITETHPNGIEHGVRSLAATASNEILLHKITKAKLAQIHTIIQNHVECGDYDHSEGRCSSAILVEIREQERQNL